VRKSQRGASAAFAESRFDTQDDLFAPSLLGKKTAMDKEEAERLVRAIERTQVDWLQVEVVELNSTTQAYELKCLYRQRRKGLFHAQESWTTLWIKNPREWIDLLTKHRDDLELP
jgi:hypothetical protein